MDNPTFAERIKVLKDMASALRAFAETISVEAQRMETAQVRFKHRVSARAKAGQQGR